MSLDQIIKKAVNLKLIECNFNQSKAALELEISRGCLRKYMDSRFETRNLKHTKNEALNFYLNKELGL